MDIILEVKSVKMVSLFSSQTVLLTHCVDSLEWTHLWVWSLCDIAAISHLWFIHSIWIITGTKWAIAPIPSPQGGCSSRCITTRRERGVVVSACEHLWSEWCLFYSCLPVALFLWLSISTIYLNIFLFLNRTVPLPLSFLLLSVIFLSLFWTDTEVYSLYQI